MDPANVKGHRSVCVVGDHRRRWPWCPMSAGHQPEQGPENTKLNSREYLPVMGDLVSLCPWRRAPGWESSSGLVARSLQNWT